MFGDGGEGTMDALAQSKEAVWRQALCETPLGHPVSARWCQAEKGTLGIAETATVVGLTHVPIKERNPLKLHSGGVGKLLEAIGEAGVKRIWLCIGGTATVDGGMGMLHALGYQFLSSHGKPLKPSGGMMERVGRVIPPIRGNPLRGIQFDIIADVANPLLGEKGAATVYGPQKGANPSAVRRLEAGMGNLARALLPLQEEIPHSDIEGMGAAGGLPLGLGVLGGKIWKGAPFVAREIGLDNEWEDTDWLVTGEGIVDKQSLMGKGPWWLAERAIQHGVRVLYVSGLPPKVKALKGMKIIAAGTDIPTTSLEASQRVQRATRKALQGGWNG